MDLADNIESCAVCGDKSTGTHYGTISCNGCKGFFRRTILRNQRFSCRFNKQCVIDKNFRCACRYCRFQKCLNAGMKREAIQFERDSVGATSRKRPSSAAGYSPSRDENNPDNTRDGFEEGDSDSVNYSRIINTLMELEAHANRETASRYRESAISKLHLHAGTDVHQAGKTNFDNVSDDFQQSKKPCTVQELNEISCMTLLIMVEWAKDMEPFAELPVDDRIILLKNYAPQHLILMPAFRSPDTTRVCLFNNTYMSRNTDQNELDGLVAFKTSTITPRVLDEIVWPMRQLQMREEEFVCLKALAFLHPEAKGLSVASQTKVREARNRILKALYSIILTHNPDEAPTRYGNILLLAPALKALTQLLIENMTLTKFFGLAEVDSLLSDFILDDSQSSLKKHLSPTSHIVSFHNNSASTSETLSESSAMAVSSVSDTIHSTITASADSDLTNSFGSGHLIPQNINNNNTNSTTVTQFPSSFPPSLGYDLSANMPIASSIIGDDRSNKTYVNEPINYPVTSATHEASGPPTLLTEASSPSVGQIASTTINTLPMNNFITTVLYNNGSMQKNTSALNTPTVHYPADGFTGTSSLSSFNVGSTGIQPLTMSVTSYTSPHGPSLPNNTVVSINSTTTATNTAEPMLTAL